MSSEVFKQAQERLDAIDKARKSYEKEIGKKCDWSDPEDVAVYRRWRNKKMREARIPQDRICSICKNQILETERWVVKQSIVCCRSCYQKQIDPNSNSSMTFVGSVFTGDLVIRVPVDEVSIRRARESTGVSRRRFAEKVGWSYERQRDLEYGKVRSIDLDTAHSILQALSELGVITEDDLPGGI